MADFLEGSLLLNGCKKLAQKVQEAKKQSLLLGRQRQPIEETEPQATRLLGRFHPAEKLISAMANSRLFSWLYGYGKNLLAVNASALLFLLTPLCLGLFLIMAVAGRWTVAGGLLCLFGLCVILFTGKGTLKELISGSLLLRPLTKPCSAAEGNAKGSVLIYLGICGTLGALIGWKLGLILGVAAAIALSLLPCLFATPPFWVVCLLLAALPLAGTTACWVLSFLLMILYFFGRAFGKEQGRALDKWDLTLLVFPLFCLISTLFSYHLAGSAKVSFLWLGLFFPVFILRRMITTRKRLVASLTALALGGTATGLYGLYQYLSGMVDTTWTDTSMFEDLEMRVYSTFANPNVFGEFLLLLIPLVLGLMLYTESKRMRFLLLGVDGLLLINLALTYSRGCYAGFALTALFFLWQFSKKWMAVILTLAVPLLLVLMPESVMERLLSIGDMSDGSTSYRMMIYFGTAYMLGHHWLGGIGLGTEAFNTIYPLYMVPDVLAEHSHSLFFQLVVSFGVMGLLYLMGLIIAYQRTTGRAVRCSSGRDRGLMLAFNTVLWGILVQSVFDYTWYNYRLFQLFWIVLALGLSAKEIIRKQDNQV